MRHQTKRHRIGRPHAHRKATLAALSTALIEHKRITTTVAKAKALRVFVEPILNRAKEDTTHNRREVFRRLQSKDAVKELFGDVANRIADRPGGFTRVVRLGHRSGDGAELAVIELVDFNETGGDGKAAGAKRRRTRRGGGGVRKAAATQAPPKAARTKTETVEQGTGASSAIEAPVAEDQITPLEVRTESPSQVEEAAAEPLSEPQEDPRVPESETPLTEDEASQPEDQDEAEGEQK